MEKFTEREISEIREQLRKQTALAREARDEVPRGLHPRVQKLREGVKE